MKSKVDPLIKLLIHRQGEAGRALMTARQRLAALELELEELKRAIDREERAFDLAQREPLLPEEHEYHHRWVDELWRRHKEMEAQLPLRRAEVEQCRVALTAIHLELKTIEKYKEKLEIRIHEERNALEKKELDEIAGQKHFRQEK